MRIKFKLAQKRLAILWFIAAALIFIIMLHFTFSGDKLKDHVNEAWGWVFPNLLPTLSLIITIFVVDIQSKSRANPSVERFYFTLVFGISIFYLAVLLWILLQPNPNPGIIGRMKQSSIFLGPLQGIVGAAIGMFFIKRSSEGGEE